VKKLSKMALKIFLPLYFILYFGVAFLAKTWIVAKRINKNPLVLPKDDSAYGLIGRYFKITLIALFIYVMVYAFTDSDIFLPVDLLEQNTFLYIGLFLLLFSLIWTIIAQAQMKDSWRIGIDHETKTELVTTGLFSVSRNPIFLGMIVSLFGLFLTTPNALTFLFFILGYVLIQIQIRLEEEHLVEQHENEYLNYKQRTKRLI
jgi:protein-S-isoprenylcysteine O-methyltransferase Ste14